MLQLLLPCKQYICQEKLAAVIIGVQATTDNDEDPCRSQCLELLPCKIRHSRLAQIIQFALDSAFYTFSIFHPCNEPFSRLHKAPKSSCMWSLCVPKHWRERTKSYEVMLEFMKLVIIKLLSIPLGYNLPGLIYTIIMLRKTMPTLLVPILFS